MHFVHTLIFCFLPSTTAVTFWMFGRNMRFVTRCEWLTFRPAEGLFPHTEQTFDIFTTSFRIVTRAVRSAATSMLCKTRRYYHTLECPYSTPGRACRPS